MKEKIDMFEDGCLKDEVGKVDTVFGNDVTP